MNKTIQNSRYSFETDTTAANTNHAPPQTVSRDPPDYSSTLEVSESQHEVPQFVERVQPQVDTSVSRKDTIARNNVIESVGAPQYVVPLEQLGEQPEWIDCPFCHRRTQTRVNKEDSSMTMVAGVLLCLLCICAACLPCACGWCQDIDHYCTECNKKVTHRPHDGRVEPIGVPGAHTVPSKYAVASQQGPTHQRPEMAYNPGTQVQSNGVK